MVHKKRRGLKVLTVCLPKPVYLVKQVIGTVRVQESEWSTTEWGESQSEDSPYVTVSWAVENSILKTPHGFVDEARGDTKLDFFNVMAVSKR